MSAYDEGKIREWHVRTHGSPAACPDYLLAMKLAEEAGEVCKALQPENDQGQAELIEELGDCVAVTIVMAGRLGLTLDHLALGAAIKLTGTST